MPPVPVDDNQEHCQSIFDLLPGGQRESGYRRQAGVENLFLRYKRVLGDSLRARTYESQKREAMMGCNVLNRMAELGKPESRAIVRE